MKKNAQISIFIIIGIIIIISAIFLINLDYDNKEIETQNYDPNDINFIKISLENCVNKLGYIGLNEILFQGGYYNLDTNYVKFANKKIPLYWNIDEKNIPSKDLIESEFNSYIIDNFEEKCIIDTVNSSIFEILYDPLDLVVNSEFEEDVFLKVKLPITIKKGSKSNSFEEFSSIIKFDFNKNFKIVEDILLEQERDPEFVPLGYVSYRSNQENFKFNLYDLENITTKVFILTFGNEGNDKKEVMYGFSLRYPMEVEE